VNGSAILCVCRRTASAPFYSAIALYGLAQVKHAYVFSYRYSPIPGT
jgi:hypothetical protein